MPWPFDQAGGTLPRTLFPLNGPSWSLFFELAVNMLFFLVGARWLQRGGQHVLLLGLLALAGFTLLSGEFNAGWSTRGMLLALVRVSTGFFLGVLIYQHRHRFPGFSPAQRCAGVALFFLVTLLPSKAVALANALMLAPAALALAADLELSGRWRRLATLLGEWSYPLYITHAPLQRGLMSLEAIQTLGLLPRVALICTVCIAFAWLANLLDIKARRWLTGWLQPTRSRVAAA